MATGFDGSIRIDTSINSKSFNTGVQSIVRSLKGLALAVGIAFSTAAIIGFSRTAVQAASDLSSAMVGLQTVAKGTGNSFSAAEEFIKEFTRDGLVPAADAITAYKTLLASGFDTAEVEKLLVSFKDVAAFNRQSAFTIGEAIKRTSEGIKNESSIAADAVGVTRNLSLMWEDYAKTLGKTADSLTRQEKLQATMNGFIKEGALFTGDAAKAANTYAGRVSALSVSFTNLKVAFGNVLIPVLTKIIPFIKQAIDGLTVLLTKVGLFMQIFFGVDTSAAQATAGLEKVGDGSEAAADGQDKLADSIDKSKKAAKGALAAFDELNVLQQPETTEAAAETPALENLVEIDEPKVDKSLEEMRKKVQAFRDRLMKLLGPAIDAFDRLKKALEPLAKTVWEGLQWAFEHILVPLAEWTITSFLPAFLDLLAASADLLNEVLIALQPAWDWFWTNVLEPLAKYTGEAIIHFLEELTLKIREVTTAWEEGGFLAAFSTGLQFAIEFWMKVIIGFVAFFIVAFIKLVLWFKEHVVQPIVDQFSQLWERIKESLMSISFADTLQWMASNVFDPLIRGFQKVFDTVSDKWKETFENITDFKGFANHFIDIVNAIIEAFITGINVINNALSSIQGTVPEWIPGIGGQTISLGVFSGNLSAPRIPHLATGAVIPPNAQFLSILGDQRSGKNIETPENLLRQIVREELASSISGDLTVTMPVYLDGEKIFDNQKRVQTRRGVSLISSGSVA